MVVGDSERNGTLGLVDCDSIAPKKVRRCEPEDGLQVALGVCGEGHSTQIRLYFVGHNHSIFSNDLSSLFHRDAHTPNERTYAGIDCNRSSAGGKGLRGVAAIEILLNLTVVAASVGQGCHL